MKELNVIPFVCSTLLAMMFSMSLFVHQEMNQYERVMLTTINTLCTNQGIVILDSNHVQVGDKK